MNCSSGRSCEGSKVNKLSGSLERYICSSNFQIPPHSSESTHNIHDVYSHSPSPFPHCQYLSCPLLGADYPVSSSLVNDAQILSASQNLSQQLDALIKGNSTVLDPSTSFSIQRFVAESNQSSFNTTTQALRSRRAQMGHTTSPRIRYIELAALQSSTLCICSWQKRVTAFSLDQSPIMSLSLQSCSKFDGE